MLETADHDAGGDADVTGKEPGNDVMTGKVTLPLIYSLKQVNESSGREIIGYLNSDKRSEEEKEVAFRKVFEFVNENGGVEYAYKRLLSSSIETGSLPPALVSSATCYPFVLLPLRHSRLIARTHRRAYCCDHPRFPTAIGVD